MDNKKFIEGLINKYQFGKKIQTKVASEEKCKVEADNEKGEFFLYLL